MTTMWCYLIRTKGLESGASFITGLQIKVYYQKIKIAISQPKHVGVLNETVLVSAQNIY